MSTIKAQKMETTNRLKTEIQIKKIRPTHTVWAGSAQCSASANNRMTAAKNL